jgi:hypothetical protein
VKVTDKRSSARRGTPGGLVVARGAADVRAALSDPQAALERGKQGPVPTDNALVRQGVQKRLGSVTGNSVSMATQKPRDLDYYWRQNNDFYDIDTEAGLKKLRDLCRKMYMTHPMIGSVVDIFAKWPLTGMELRCKDEKLVEFYSELFFDRLDYEEFLVDVGREYWSVGEALPFGTWSETLGIWESDELVHPDDVRVHRSPFLREPVLEMRLPEEIRRILFTREPRAQYEALMRAYPGLDKYASSGEFMPVSNHLLKQLRFKGHTFHERGIPIMVRGIRAILQEEMLNAAQDAISDRLSTPLILARVGASASDLGTQDPWIPTAEQLSDFEGLLDSALAADFRVLTTHFAVNLSSVFGRETMPNFDPTFERITERILQVWGMSKTMLSGSSSGQTYAADAMNRDLITQLASSYQRVLRKFVRERMLVVAEAQEHYDYEERGGKRYPIMEEVLEVDPQGNYTLVEQPKLLVPELHLKPMSLADEEARSTFIESLRASGVPVSMKTRLANRDVNLDEEIEASREERIRLAVEEQKTRRETYLALREQNLPIPDDLRADFEPVATEGQEREQPAETEEGVGHAVGLGEQQQPLPNLAPVAGDEGAGQEGQAPGGNVIPLPLNKAVPPAIEGRTRPPESDEQRAGMPRPAALAQQVDEEGNLVVEPAIKVGPSHIGLRRYARISKDTPLDEQTG